MALREGRRVRSDRLARIEGARAEVGAVAREFALAARPVVQAALHRRLDAFLARADGIGALRPAAVRALRDTTDRAIEQAGAEVERRLTEPDLWLSPEVVPGGVEQPLRWGESTPGWLSGLLGRLSRHRGRIEVVALDDVGNRAWIALLSAAKSLDLVLEEFGFRPSDVPDPGGGHFGLQPRSAAHLDPSGTLERIWKRYRSAYLRYAAVVREPD